MVKFLLLISAFFALYDCRDDIAMDRGKDNGLWLEALIPFKIDEDVFDTDVIRNIREAMNNWERNTCIRFVPYIDQSDYILISYSETG